MKVTVNNQDKEEVIDWNKEQLVKGTESGEIVLISRDQEYASEHHFCGVQISMGFYSKEFVKKYFKPFHGSITLQND